MSRKLGETQKYNQAHSYAQLICQTLSHQNTELFKQNIEVLKQLNKMWISGKEVLVVEVIKEAEHGTGTN